MSVSLSATRAPALLAVLVSGLIVGLSSATPASALAEAPAVVSPGVGDGLLGLCAGVDVADRAHVR
ncbi:MAG TPA: hypothetical protein VIR33_12875, partial [Thermopolyspora sp.]